MAKRLGELTPEPFDQVAERVLSEDFEKLTPEEFFGAWAAVEEERGLREITLSGHLENGAFVIDEPALLPVRGNRVMVSSLCLAIELKEKRLEEVAG
jgi:hypothetical protein